MRVSFFNKEDFFVVVVFFFFFAKALAFARLNRVGATKNACGKCVAMWLMWTREESKFK